MKYEKIEVKSSEEVKSGVKKWSQGKNEVKSRRQEWRNEEGKNE